MSRVLLVSMGVPAYVAARRHGGPGLRAAHFAHALSRAGADVLALCVRTPGDEVTAPPSGPTGLERVETLFTEERTIAAMTSDGAMKRRSGPRPSDGAGDLLRRRIEEFAPQAVVGVTVYGAAMALRLRLDVPLWADVFGDLLSEAQAKAAINGSDWSLVHFWTLLRPVLERADRFSAVSAAQSHALVGQLGIAGRLSARTAGEELVSVIPCAAEPPCDLPSRSQARAQLELPGNAFVLLWSGGFNTWCDVDTAAGGIVAAMQQVPDLHLLVSGGTIPGHDDESFGRFRATIDAAASVRSRVHLLGWVPSQQVPSLYAASDLGLNIERPLYERRLGAENRVAEWQANGLACVTTALSEAGADLVRRGLAWKVPVADAGSLAACIAELAVAPSLAADRGRQCREVASNELRFDSTAAALCQWCLAPVRAGDHGSDRFVQLGLLSSPQGSAELLEAYVRQLPMSQLLRRGLRWTLRRGIEAVGAAARISLRSNRRR